MVATRVLIVLVLLVLVGFFLVRASTGGGTGCQTSDYGRDAYADC